MEDDGVSVFVATSKGIVNAVPAHHDLSPHCLVIRLRGRITLMSLSIDLRDESRPADFLWEVSTQAPARGSHPTDCAPVW